MHWTLEFQPILPIPVLAAATLIALVIVAVLFWRGRRGAFLRAASMALLLAALVNPNFKEEEREPLTSIAVVVLDDSASQHLAGRDKRMADIRGQLAKTFEMIPNLEIRWVTSTHDSSGASDETALFASLNQALADVPAERLAGVVMVTDGQIHDVPADVKRLGLAAPVHALITGSRGEFDNWLEVISAPRFGLVDSTQMVELRAITSLKGHDAPQTAVLKIRREAEPEERITVPFGKTVRLPFPFPHAGSTLMEVELVAKDGELTKANNRAVLQAEGVRENLRVLLVSGEPHVGERTWRNLLRSDASVDLVHFTILRPPEKSFGTRTDINQLSLIAFPTRELFSEKLSQFDLIIFDRYQRHAIEVLPLIYLDNVARYVKKGGAVLVAAGSGFASPMSLYYTPLGDALPSQPSGRVIEKPFRAALTEQGVRHPVTAGLSGSNDSPAEAPTWGPWFRLIVTKPMHKSEVLMSGPDNLPVLTLAQYGKGRVATLLSDHVWLWARGYEGGGPHSDLLRKLSHWLMKEPDLEEEYLKASADGQRITIERRSMKDNVGAAKIASPTGKTHAVPMTKAKAGLWRGRLVVDEPGVHKITMDGLSAVVLVGDANSREFAKVTATDAPLRPVSTATRGGQFWMGGTNGAPAAKLPRITMQHTASKYYGQNWLGLKNQNAYIVRGVRYTPLFAGFIGLALFL
ncbi:MAG: hypothetical protein P8Y36_05315, partial [Alphaproteobacteria bacterium]